jgi:hypothetical protein
VAAGGGGAECCSGAWGGDGGGLIGAAGGTVEAGASPGGGGTQSSGGIGGTGCNGSGADGSVGQGGVGGNGDRAGGGGGGGYYGGGGGGGCSLGSGGGGGSSYSAGTQTTLTPGFQTSNGQVIISLGGSSATAQQNVLFAGINITPVVYLDDQVRSYTDSRARKHTYHVFATSKDPNKNLFSLQLATAGSGSLLSVEVPSGGNPTDTDSGGALQLILPFGLTVTSITGYNAEFGSPGTGNTWSDALKCELVGQVEALVDMYTAGGYGAYKRAQACSLLAPIPLTTDGCDVIYPIITPASTDCLISRGPIALYGEPVLNSHQIRNVQWKPKIEGLSFSRLEFHLAETTNQVLTTVQQKGVTVYVHTPVADYFLDNFR